MPENDVNFNKIRTFAHCNTTLCKRLLNSLDIIKDRIAYCESEALE